MEKFTTALIEILAMGKTLPASRFYALWGIAVVIAIAYAARSAAVLIEALK